MSGFTSATLAGPPYASGTYNLPEGEGLAGGAANAAGVIRVSPGYIRRSVTISALLVRLTTLAASGNFQIALYAADPVTNNPTGAPLFTSASQSTAATGIKEIAAALTLPKGLYWLGVQVDTNGAAAVFASFAFTAAQYYRQPGAPSSTNLLNPAVGATLGLTKAGTYGTWPTFTGTGTGADGFAESTNSSTPCWAFKVA